jgi:hypothetical protein
MIPLISGIRTVCCDNRGTSWIAVEPYARIIGSWSRNECSKVILLQITTRRTRPTLPEFVHHTLALAAVLCRNFPSALMSPLRQRNLSCYLSTGTFDFCQLTALHCTISPDLYIVFPFKGPAFEVPRTDMTNLLVPIRHRLSDIAMASMNAFITWGAETKSSF